MHIIQALPGSGKSYLANDSSFWADSDKILLKIQDQIGVSALSEILKSKNKIYLFKKILIKYYGVLFNFQPELLGYKCDIRFAYKPNVYIDHLKQCDRFDMIDTYGEERIIRWANWFINKDRVIWLSSGEFLSDRLNKF